MALLTELAHPIHIVQSIGNSEEPRQWQESRMLIFYEMAAIALIGLKPFSARL